MAGFGTTSFVQAKFWQDGCVLDAIQNEGPLVFVAGQSVFQ